jgi:hypothetical protein
MASKERQIMTTTIQLELGFTGTQRHIFGRRRELRLARAQWWFARMREAVEKAWPEPAATTTEQIWIPGANRTLKV